MNKYDVYYKKDLILVKNKITNKQIKINIKTLTYNKNNVIINYNLKDLLEDIDLIEKLTKEEI